MTVTLIRPTAVVSENGIGNGIGAGTHLARINDNSDTTSIRNTVPGLGASLVAAFSGYSTPAGSYIRRVRCTAREATTLFIGNYDVSFSIGTIHDLVNGYNTLDNSGGHTTAFNLISSWQPTVQLDYSGTSRPWVDTDINDVNGLLVVGYNANPGFGGTYNEIIDVYDVWAEVETNALPTATVTAPTGTISTTTRPTCTFQYNDSDGDALSRYVLKIFDAATYGAGGFDPATATAAFSTDVSTSLAAGSTVNVVPTLDLTNGTTYKAYVLVYQVVDSKPAAAYAVGPAFTISLDAPAQPVVTALADNANGRIQVVVQARDDELTKNQADIETDTSGWTATNATLTRITSQFAHGAASLQLASVAAGDMYVNTPGGTSGFPVVPGKVYNAMASYRRISATANRNVTIGIGWMDAAGSFLNETDAAGTVADNNTGWTLRTVQDVAPANAAFAYVRLYVQGCTAAAEQHAVDSISFAPSSPNLLSSDDAGFASSIGTWVNSFNCTPTRTTTIARTGVASMQMSSNAAGDMYPIASITAYKAHQSQVYNASCYFRAAATGRTIQIVIYFIDGGGSLFSSAVSPSLTDTATGWTKCSVTAIAPAGTVGITVVVRVLATGAAGEIHYVDDVQIQQLPNLLTDNNSFQATSVGDWGNPVNCTIARSTAQSFAGVASLAHTATGAGQIFANNGNVPFPVVPGTQYVVVAAYRANTTGRNVFVGVDWLPLNTQEWSPAQVDSNAGWVVCLYVTTAPAGATSAYLITRVDGVGGAGEVHYANAMMMCPLSAFDWPGVDFVWTRGAFVDANQTIFLQKSVDGGVTWSTWTPRAGSLVDPPVGQQVTYYDYEAPAGIAVQYRARVSGKDTTLSQYPIAGPFSAALSATSNPTTSTGWLLKDPLDPTQNQVIDMSSPAWETNIREEQAVYNPLGRTMPVVVSDVVHGIDANIDIDFLTVGAWTAFKTMRNKQHTLLLQRVYTGEQWYVRLGAVLKTVEAPTGYFKTTIGITEVDPP